MTWVKNAHGVLEHKGTFSEPSDDALIGYGYRHKNSAPVGTCVHPVVSFAGFCFRCGTRQAGENS